MRMQRALGFTLVEVVIALLIVSLLTAIALPSYKAHVVKTRRTDAQAALMGLAQAMERHFTSNMTYATAITGAAPKQPDADVYPSQAPLDGANKYYDLVVTAVDGTSFTLQAQPIAGTAQEDDGILQLDNLGNRVWDRDNDADLDEDEDQCWSKEC